MKNKILVAITLCSIAFAAPASANNPAAPQNQVTGTDQKLFNGMYAEEASWHVVSAREAIARCDEAAFIDSQSKLRKIKKRLGYAADFHDGDAEFYNMFVPAAVDMEKLDERAIAQVMGTLLIEWKRVQPCGRERRELRNAINISMQLTAGMLSSFGFTNFLGIENGGGGNRQLDVVKSKDEGRTQGASGELRVPLKAIPNALQEINDALAIQSFFWDFFFGFAWGKGNISGDLGQFDPAGQTMLFPGIGAGPNPAGFAVAAPNGLVNQMVYRSDFDYLSFDLGLGRTFPVSNTNDTKLRPYGGLTYGHFDSYETFSGNLPNVVRTFRYSTDIENRYIGPFVGVEFSTRPDVLRRLFMTDIELNSNVRYSYLFNDADGTDMLAFQGFTPGTVDIGENDTTHDVKADLGFTINPDGPVSFTIGGSYHYLGNVPSIQRDGVNVSQIKFENGHSYSAALRTTFRF